MIGYLPNPADTCQEKTTVADVCSRLGLWLGTGNVRSPSGCSHCILDVTCLRVERGVCWRKESIVSLRNPYYGAGGVAGTCCCV